MRNADSTCLGARAEPRVRCSVQDLLLPSGSSGTVVFSEALVQWGWLLRPLLLLIPPVTFKTHPVKCPHQGLGEAGLSATSHVR